MKRFALIIAIIVLLILGGAITANITSTNSNTLFPAALKQTDNPDASVFVSTPQKSELLFLLVGFIIFNMVGMGATIAVVMWFLHRQVKSARASDGTGTNALQASQPESSVEPTA